MKMSAIVISHHMGEIESLCSKVVVLDRGTVVEIMEIKDIVDKYGSLNSFSRRLISKSNEALRKAAAKSNKSTQELKMDKKKKKTKLQKQVEKQNNTSYKPMKIKAIKAPKAPKPPKAPKRKKGGK